LPSQQKHISTLVLRVLPFTFKTIWDSGRWLFLSITLTNVLSGVLPVASVFIEMKLLNEIVALLQPGRTTEFADICLWIGIRLLISSGSMLLARANSLLVFTLGKHVTLNMGTQVLNKLSMLDMVNLDEPEVYDRVTRASNQAREKPVRILMRLNRATRSLITFFSMGALIASFSLVLFITMFAVCVPMLVILACYAEKHYKAMYIRTEEQRKADYLQRIMTSRDQIPEIVSLGLWQHLIGKWFSLSRKFVLQDIRILKSQSVAESIVQVMVVVSEAIALGYTIYVGITRLLTVGEIMMYSRAFSSGLSCLHTIVENVSGTYEDVLFFYNYLELHDTRSCMNVICGTRPVPADIQCIELKNVTFRYPEAQCDVLRNVSFRLERSRTTLLVGKNGAGKTTLIRLLMRLYDPCDGRILINGTDLREFDIKELRRAVGVNFQDYARFSLSARENIGYGCIVDLLNENKIMKSAEQAKAWGLINQLPFGLDTILSRAFTGGVELSGGQWQRISLSRLFMKDSPIVIFDEPSVSLDIDAEAQLIQEIMKMAQNRICLIASHRMFKPGIAEHVIVMSNGELVEWGTHDELLARQGEYARQWRVRHQQLFKRKETDTQITSSDLAILT